MYHMCFMIKINSGFQMEIHFTIMCDTNVVNIMSIYNHI